ncbi:MAG: hypothetical protein JSW20_06835 [Nitrospiraceae bacterium]|nr:MAG: hypothetical protein JSW20_06835 [Nitrospiraceae bacterium]
MKQNAIHTIADIKRHRAQKSVSKYAKIIEAFEHYDIIRENSHAKVTVKFNNGGILYIEVEDKKVFK